MGTGGRGSWPGLEEALSGLIAALGGDALSDPETIAVALERDLSPEAQEVLLFLSHAGSAMGAGAIPVDAHPWRWLERSFPRRRAGGFLDHFILPHVLEALRSLDDLRAPENWRRPLPDLESPVVEEHHLREGPAAIHGADRPPGRPRSGSRRRG